MNKANKDIWYVPHISLSYNLFLFYSRTSAYRTQCDFDALNIGCMSIWYPWKDILCLMGDALLSFVMLSIHYYSMANVYWAATQRTLQKWLLTAGGLLIQLNKEESALWGHFELAFDIRWQVWLNLIQLLIHPSLNCITHPNPPWHLVHFLDSFSPPECFKYCRYLIAREYYDEESIVFKEPTIILCFTDLWICSICPFNY